MKKSTRIITKSLMALLIAGLGSTTGFAQDASDDDSLSQQLANPLASLISVPFKFDYDSGYGPNDGWRFTTTIQPVVPIRLNDDWTLVARTLFPIIKQNDIAGNSGSQFGLGDTSQALFFVPKTSETALGAFTYGFGPAFTLPTSTDSMLGSGTWGAGPTGVFLFQESGWTWGALATQQWGVAKTRSGVPDFNVTALQPFLAYSQEGWTVSLNTESSYNWTSDEWSVPVNLTLGKIVSFGNQKVQLTGGVRYWADSPAGGPDDIGFRFQATFLFPK